MHHNSTEQNYRTYKIIYLVCAEAFEYGNTIVSSLELTWSWNLEMEIFILNVIFSSEKTRSSRQYFFFPLFHYCFAYISLN